MSDTKKLRGEWEQAEQKAQQLQAEKDDAIDKLRAKYTQKLRDAVDEAAAAQKRFLDAEAADALRDRPDGKAVADALGLTLD
jgi:hypothetical protein